MLGGPRLYLLSPASWVSLQEGSSGQPDFPAPVSESPIFWDCLPPRMSSLTWLCQEFIQCLCFLLTLMWTCLHTLLMSWNLTEVSSTQNRTVRAVWRERLAEVHTCLDCHTGGGCAALVARALAGLVGRRMLTSRVSDYHRICSQDLPPFYK